MSRSTINAIIVDDEPGCVANLQYHLDKFCPDIHVIASADTLLKIPEQTDGRKIDLAFLDIELFDDNIFNALQRINNIDFKIVFVTAYEKYALKAWKVDALDYLLKPLSEDDIKDCYNKIQKHFLLYAPLEFQHDGLPGDDSSKGKKVLLKDNDKVYIIKAEDIFFISGNGFYSTITFHFGGEEKTIVVSKPLNKIEMEYGHSDFFRVHKSYIVNVNYIASITRDDGTSLKMKNGKMIPVAKRRLNEFLSFLNQKV